MGVDTQQIQGFDDLAAKLREIPKAMRKRVLRNSLAAGARLVRDAARRSAPVLSAAAARKAPYRTPGLLKNSVVVRTSKQDRRNGNVGVFVNVRPAKSGMRGAKSKSDPFYWRFVNFGTAKMPARPFLSGAAAQLPQALQVFQSAVGKWVAKTNATGKVNP
jgi:HK97 gp10 family phage protein